MKKIVFLAILFFSIGSALAQTDHKVSESVATNEHFVIGLDKATSVELGFIKEELSQISRITSAEFIYKDKVLLIETDPKNTPYLTYNELEGILLKYFNQKNILAKEFSSFDEVKAEFYKSDKIIIK